MLIRVDPDSPIGLAEQIAGQVRGALVSGELAAGEKLPPAVSSPPVSTSTCTRCCGPTPTLRDEGLIDLRRGRGAQVRANVDLGLTELEQQIDELLRSAQRLGMSRAQLAARIQEA